MMAFFPELEFNYDVSGPTSPLMSQDTDSLSFLDVPTQVGAGLPHHLEDDRYF